MVEALVSLIGIGGLLMVSALLCEYVPWIDKLLHRVIGDRDFNDAPSESGTDL